MCLCLFTCSANILAKYHNSQTNRGILHPIVRVSDGKTCFSDEPITHEYLRSWEDEAGLLKWLAFHDQPKPEADPNRNITVTRAAKAAVKKFMGVD